MWPLLLGWKVMEVTKAVLVESVGSAVVVAAAGQVQSMPWKRDAVGEGKATISEGHVQLVCELVYHMEHSCKQPAQGLVLLLP